MAIISTLRHRLGAALRFVDVFTAKAIHSPLDVRADSLPVVPGMPRVPWAAVRAPVDDTYRFQVSNNEVMPAGNIAVTVQSPGLEYVDFEPITVLLPRPLVAHPPTPARSDFLVEHALWPTRSLRLPPGETAIVARCVGTVTPIAGLKVTIWLDGTAKPASPYAYTNVRGEFVYRLPDLKKVNGGVISTTATLQMEIRTPPPPYVAVVAPTQIKTDLGAVITVPFAVPLGQVTNLTITLP